MKQMKQKGDATTTWSGRNEPCAKKREGPPDPSKKRTAGERGSLIEKRQSTSGNENPNDFFLKICSFFHPPDEQVDASSATAASRQTVTKKHPYSIVISGRTARPCRNRLFLE
jgi:hypothetical protein